MGTLAIDPSTGERITQPPSSPQIDPSTGERIVAAPAAALHPESGIHSFLSALGIQTPSEAKQQAQEHPVISALKALGGPAVDIGEGIYNQGKQTVQEALQAYQSLKNGNPAEAAVHGISAVPLVGPALVKAANQAPALTGTYGHQVAQVIHSPAIGTLAGTAAAVAPMVAGGVDAALPGRPLIGAIPNLDTAGAIHADLKSKLANEPVPLNAALAPLQRAVEIGGRGATLPKAITDLLARSESPIGTDMTFPEARDYQSSLTDLSAQDNMNMSKRMKGALSQVNKGLFTDIQNAAEAGKPGLGDVYADAMNQTRRAYKLNNAASVAGKWLGRGAAGAIGAGTVFGLGKAIKDSQ